MSKELYHSLAKSDVIREIQAYFYRVPAEKRFTIPTTSDTTGQVVQRIARPGYLSCGSEFLRSLEFFELSIVEILLYKKGSLTSFAEYYTFNDSVNGKQIIPFAIEKNQMTTDLIVKINGMSENARIDMATFDILKDIDSLRIKIRKTLNKYSLSADDLRIDGCDINILK